MSFVFYQKENVRAFIIILGVTLKAVAFESYSEINGFVEIFFRDQFFLILLFIYLFIYLFIFSFNLTTNKKLLVPLYCKINSNLLSDYAELIGYLASVVNVVSSNPNFHHEQYAHTSPY